MASGSKLAGRLATAALLPLIAALGGKDPPWLIAILALVGVLIVIAAEIIERREHRGGNAAAAARGPSP